MTAVAEMNQEFGGLTKEFTENLLCAKYIGWNYENEVRVIVPLETKDSTGLCFSDFEGNMELKEVILGPRSDLKIYNVAQHLHVYKNEVKVMRSRIAFTKYEVVQNKAARVYVHRP